MDDAPKEHKKKTMLLMYFAQYMDEDLIHGGDMLVKKDERQMLPLAVFMKKWFRTNRAIVMYLNNGTLQVMINSVYKNYVQVDPSYYMCMAFGLLNN